MLQAQPLGLSPEFYTHSPRRPVARRKTSLDAGSRAELVGLIEDYRTGLVALVVSVTLIRHHVRRFDVASLAGQTYLEPHPKELMLRNHF